jgi:2-polyprenyl-6-methoxyphenol hydroxylase-like FAD-dependent oxidoreductase
LHHSLAKFDAIVIGAGAAGLACACDLTGAGKRVCILEARDPLALRDAALTLSDSIKWYSRRR